MAVNIPDFLNAPIQGNPYHAGVSGGMDLASKGLENYVAGSVAPYAPINAFLKARHQELVNQALPLQYIMQYSKDPTTAIASILQGKYGEVLRNTVNQMLNLSQSQSNIPRPRGYIDPASLQKSVAQETQPIDEKPEAETSETVNLKDKKGRSRVVHKDYLKTEEGRQALRDEGIIFDEDSAKSIANQPLPPPKKTVGDYLVEHFTKNIKDLIGPGQ